VDADGKTLGLCKTNITPVSLCANNKKGGKIFNRTDGSLRILF